MGQQRALKLIICLAGLAIFVTLEPTHALAQLMTEVQVTKTSLKEDKDPSAETSILPQPDRETLKLLKDAKLLIEKERFGEAVRILGDILSSPDDSFFATTPPSKEGLLQIRGLHDEAEQMLGVLPQRAIELYELQFGAQAKRLLQIAIDEGDTRAPADISRRFFHTDAGAQATWLSALASMDEGRWKAAALAFERLQKLPAKANQYEPLLSVLKAISLEQAGEHESAEQTWETLQKRTSNASVQLAGKVVPLFGNATETFDEFLARTELSGEGAFELGTSSNLAAISNTDRTLPLGTPQRNASVDAGLPLLKQTWRARITDRPLAETQLRKQREACIDNGTITIPRFYPLVVDGVLFGRTLNTLIAIDTKTGKRLWEAEIEKADETAQAMLTSIHRPTQIIQNLMRRIWEDSIFGQLSSDKRNVYAIEEININNEGITVQQQAAPAVVMARMASDQDQGPNNALVAFDAKTGQRRWVCSKDTDGTPFFFLGPPLPMDGTLYALAESQGEMNLVAIAPASGEVDWSQRIAVIEKPTARHLAISYAAENTNNARMPAVADGVMVCPTGVGAIIAIDPTTRALLWAHCYERLGKQQNRVVFVNGIPRGQNQDRIGEELLIHDGKVFSAPFDSNYLYCLDLITGKELWKKDFSDNAFLGGVYKDHLLMVGNKKFQTLDTENGNPIHSCEVGKMLGEEDYVLITGCGFRNEGIYYAPTSSHHIVAFDIEKGKIIQQTCTREPIILGNLVAAEDRIFSQSLDGIEAFHQLKAIRTKTEKQLKENPNDLAAIAMEGELLLAEDKIDLAIEKFRHVHRTQPTPISGARLLNAFCIALKDSYPQYRDARPEIESLLQTEEQRSEYWYLCIRGEIAEHHLDSAADACFHLANLENRSQMIKRGRYQTVRQDRFVQTQLGIIYENLDPAEQEKLAQKILVQLDAVLESGDLMDLHRAWNCYASLPPVATRYYKIIEKIWKIDPALAELILERTIRFGDREEAATAMIHWAELLRSANRTDDAAACYREAIRQWKEVPLLTGQNQTPYSKVAAMSSDDPVRASLVSHDQWPQGHTVEQSKMAQSQDGFRNVNTRVHIIPIGTPSPIFRDKQLLYTGQNLELRDSYNREVWSLSLVDENDPNVIYYGHQGMRCSTVGHMIFLELPNRLIAINAWNPNHPKIAWQTERGAIANIPGMPTASSNFCRMHFAGFTQGMFSQSLNPLGVPGIDFGFQLLTLSGTELVAVDPFDGSTLWSQRKLPNQIDLNSDGNLLFVSQPNRNNEPTIMMRLIDGGRDVPIKSKSTSAKDTAKNAQDKNTEKEEMARKAGELAAKLFMNANRSNTRPPQKILSLGRNMLTFTDSRVPREYRFALVDCLTKETIWGPKKYNYQVKWRLLDQDYIGVIDREGNFELFRIADGKTLIRQQLKLDGTLQGIFLQSMGDRVGVIVWTNPKANQTNNNMSYLPIIQYLQQGRIYTFGWDGQPGMSKHEDGVLVQQQGFLLEPPTRLPVVTLMSQTIDQKNPKNPWKTKFQVIDNRSGEEILSKEISESIQSFEIIGNPDENTVEYQLNEEKYTIRFK